MKATVGRNGKITIPKILRDRLGLHPGTGLEIQVVDGRLVGSKVVVDNLDEIIGILSLPRGGTDALVRELRGAGPTDEEA